MRAWTNCSCGSDQKKSTIKKGTMKLKNEDKVIIGVGVLGLGTIGFLYWRSKTKQKEQDELTADIAEPPTVLATPILTDNIPIAGATLNKNKVLAKGSKGLEVRELQRVLGVAVDGDFGSATLSALQAKKGVSSISLNAYLTNSVKTKVAIKANPTALVTPKKGQKLMANANDVSLFNAKKTASGTYFNDGTKPLIGGVYDYGQHIGTFEAVKTGNQYLINRNGVYYFVNGNQVKAY